MDDLDARLDGVSVVSFIPHHLGPTDRSPAAESQPLNRFLKINFQYQSQCAAAHSP